MGDRGGFVKGEIGAGGINIRPLRGRKIDSLLRLWALLRVPLSRE